MTHMCVVRVQDCAVLAWSLARLAYRDDELMAALRQRYLDTSVLSAQSVGTVSQMLKGCAVAGALTRELYLLLLEQAEGALGSAERAQRMAQQVRDGCALPPPPFPSAPGIGCVLLPDGRSLRSGARVRPALRVVYACTRDPGVVQVQGDPSG